MLNNQVAINTKVPEHMEKSKIKIEELKIKSFVTSTKVAINAKAKRNDGGYTWVG